MAIPAGWQAIPYVNRFSEYQRKILRHHFQESTIWWKEKREMIAREIGISENRVKNWYTKQTLLMKKQENPTTSTGTYSVVCDIDTHLTLPLSRGRVVPLK